eukprot:SAG22_NODE_7746_length_712_cov_0.727569_2_plen_61_part_01
MLSNERTLVHTKDSTAVHLNLVPAGSDSEVVGNAKLLLQLAQAHQSPPHSHPRQQRSYVFR